MKKETKPCEMPGCCDPATGKPREIPLDSMVCRACHSWHYYHRKQTANQFAFYASRVKQAAGRIHAFAADKPKHNHKKKVA